MSLHFCTFFDHGYLSRGLSLYDSLVEQSDDFVLHVLALTPQCHDTLQAMNLPNMLITDLATVEQGVSALSMVRRDRSLAAYYFTLKPVWLRWVLKQNTHIETITYLDSDMFFFADPALAVAEMDGYSVSLTPHRFPSHLKSREKYGVFNAGWVSFRRDDAGLACLDWWHDSCLEWCEDTVRDDGAFADQGYLTLIPERFTAVKVIAHKGINLAPWNISACQVTETKKSQQQRNSVMVDDQLLILFHFHGLKGPHSKLYFPNVSAYQAALSSVLRERVYRPYIRTLKKYEALSDAASGGRRDANRSARGKAISARNALALALKRDVMF